MPVEIVWIAAVVAAGSCILGSALYADLRRFGRMFAKLPPRPTYRTRYDATRLPW